MERCDRCGQLGEDRRTLWMACFYEMNELDIPFEQKVLQTEGATPETKTFYTLRVCKDCRAAWMEAIQAWFQKELKEEYPTEPSTEACIPVRINGSVRFLTEEQFYARNSEDE